MVERCSVKYASRTLALAAITLGWPSRLVPSVWVRPLSSWSRAAATPLRAALSDAWAWVTMAWACATSSRETAPLPLSDWRRARSSLARLTSICALVTSASRSVICASSVVLLAYRLRTWRTAWASCACAVCKATWASAVSSCTTVCPLFTKSVSSAWMALTVPPICGVICTTLPCT